MTQKIIFFISFLFVASVSTAMSFERYVSLTDLDIYAHHSTAKLLASELEDFARGALGDLQDQSLISIRPQAHLESGKKLILSCSF